MKRNRNVIILVVVLVVLVLAYLGLRFWNQRTEEEEEAREEAEAVHLVSDTDFSAMGYADGSDSVSFTNKSGTWTYDPDSEIALQQSEMQTIETDIENLTAVRELEDPDPLEDYGLTDPAYSIWYTAGGTTNTIYIGNMADENYYATVNDTQKVYTITDDILMDMHFDLIEIAELDNVPAIGSGNLLRVEILRPDADESEVYTEQSDLDQLAGGFGAMDLDSVKNYHASAADLEEYGLDAADRTTVTATYTDNDTEEETTFTVYIGGVAAEEDDDEERYVTVEDSKIVYMVSQSVLDNMTTVSEEEEETEEAE